MQRFSQEDILSMDSSFRRNFVNTLAGFKSANLIGTISETGNKNLAIFNSVIHLGAHPPLMGFILRPLTVPRQTYENIKSEGYYTINHVNEQIVGQSHQTSAKYDENTSEFDKTQLTIENSDLHPAPYVAESNIKIGLKYREEHLINANGTVLIVGEVIEVFLNNSYADTDGFLNLDEAKTVAISGLDGYYAAKKISRFQYARPNQATKAIK